MPGAGGGGGALCRASSVRHVRLVRAMPMPVSEVGAKLDFELHRGYSIEPPRRGGGGWLNLRAQFTGRIFLRHGGPPPKALHQSGLTTGKAFMASRSSPKTVSIVHKFHTQGAENTALMHHRPGKGQSAQQECRGKLSAMG